VAVEVVVLISQDRRRVDVATVPGMSSP